jgi:hypothetical protein
MKKQLREINENLTSLYLAEKSRGGDVIVWKESHDSF